jgi:hypothetical protein
MKIFSTAFGSPSSVGFPGSVPESLSIHPGYLLLITSCFLMDLKNPCGWSGTIHDFSRSQKPTGSPHYRSIISGGAWTARPDRVSWLFFFMVIHQMFDEVS